MYKKSAQQNQANYAHVENSLQVTIVGVIDRKKRDTDSSSHGLRPKDCADAVAVNRAARQFRKQGQPKVLNSSGGNVIRGFTAQTHQRAIVDRAGHCKQNDNGQETEYQPGLCFPAPYQKQTIHENETEEGAARKSQDKRDDYHDH